MHEKLTLQRVLHALVLLLMAMTLPNIKVIRVSFLGAVERHTDFFFKRAFIASAGGLQEIVWTLRRDKARELLLWG